MVTAPTSQDIVYYVTLLVNEQPKSTIWFPTADGREVMGAFFGPTGTVTKHDPDGSTRVLRMAFGTCTREEARRRGYSPSFLQPWGRWQEASYSLTVTLTHRTREVASFGPYAFPLLTGQAVLKEMLSVERRLVQVFANTPYPLEGYLLDCAWTPLEEEPEALAVPAEVLQEVLEAVPVEVINDKEAHPEERLTPAQEVRAWQTFLVEQLSRTEAS